MNGYRTRAKYKKREILCKKTSEKIPPLVSSFYPAISVIIPVYNREEYIGECLDNLVAQTFQDFEVIVVDDCSTDNTFAIVESYREKFGERLKIDKTETNSGRSGVPRNIALKLAKGEYISFLDSDDFLDKTAFEVLYSSAKEYNADVVYTGVHYYMPSPNELCVFRDGTGKNLLKKGLEDTPILTVNNPNKLIEEYLYEERFHSASLRFVRRELLVENKILFPETLYLGEDNMWCISILCHCKIHLRLSKLLYFRRYYNTGSITRSKRPPAEQIFYRVQGLALFLKGLNKLTNEIPLLRETPRYHYENFKIVTKWSLNTLREYRMQLTDSDIYSILYKKFVEENIECEPLTPFFFSFIDAQEKELNELKGIVRTITARLDIKLFAAGDFQILSVSDEKATINKPNWFQKNGVGYVINSFAGNVTFVAKASVAGQIKLFLRGMDIKDPEDKSKRIPCWIYYTKLAVNGKIIFDTLTPTWHNKPYNYTIDAKADEEVKVEVEWLPHGNGNKTKGDFMRKNNTALQEFLFDKKSNTSIANKNAVQINPKFMLYLTARLDIKLFASGDFQILSLSDDKANVIKPDWFQKDGTGYIINSYTGNIAFVAKAAIDGQVRLILRGMDIRDPKDKSKRIPYWIDYTKLIINGKTIFDTLTPIWHDKFYRHIIDAKADEEIKIEVEWLPHRSDT